MEGSLDQTGRDKIFTEIGIISLKGMVQAHSNYIIKDYSLLD